MNPVLIFKDENQILNEKTVLNNSVDIVQSIYNALIAINVQPSLQEISNLIIWTIKRNGAVDFEREYVINKLLDAAAPYVMNGVPLTRAAVRTMIAVPNIDGVLQALSEAHHVFNSSVNGLRINLLSLTNGVVSKINDSEAQITADYTFYTKTDASATLANSLQAVCDTLNGYDASHDNALSNGLKFGVHDVQKETQLKGIALLGNTFTISLNYIRKFEGGYSLNQ